MKVRFHLINKNEEENVIFNIHKQTEFLEEIGSLLENYQLQQILVKDYQKNIDIHLNLSEIMYIEYVDRKCFFYTETKTYEKRITLNKVIMELSTDFIQISKSIILSIRSVSEIKSSLLNGNLYCLLKNNEELIISRHFSKEFRQAIQQTHFRM